MTRATRGGLFHGHVTLLSLLLKGYFVVLPRWIDLSYLYDMIGICKIMTAVKSWKFG